jgi:hypothetical protein
VATISSLLAEHVTLRVRSVDRLFLQGYVPRLMTAGQVIRFLLDRGYPIPSPAMLGKIGRDYVSQSNAFIASNQIPTVRFVKGDVKEEIARKHFQAAEREGRFGVVMVGIAAPAAAQSPNPQNRAAPSTPRSPSPAPPPTPHHTPPSGPPPPPTTTTAASARPTPPARSTADNARRSRAHRPQPPVLHNKTNSFTKLTN